VGGQGPLEMGKTREREQDREEVVSDLKLTLQVIFVHLLLLYYTPFQDACTRYLYEITLNPLIILVLFLLLFDSVCACVRQSVCVCVCMCV